MYGSQIFTPVKSLKRDLTMLIRLSQALARARAVPLAG